MHADDVTVAAPLRWVLVNASVDVMLQNDDHLALVPRGSLAVEANSSGALAGELVDRDTGAPVPVPCGTVTLLGTELGRFTDPTGHFLTARLPPMRCVLRARQIGYAPVDSIAAVRRESTTQLE